MASSFFLLSQVNGVIRLTKDPELVQIELAQRLHGRRIPLHHDADLVDHIALGVSMVQEMVCHWPGLILIKPVGMDLLVRIPCGNRGRQRCCPSRPTGRNTAAFPWSGRCIPGREDGLIALVGKICPGVEGLCSTLWPGCPRTMRSTRISRPPVPWAA